MELVAYMGEGRVVYKVLVWRSEGKRLLGKPGYRWEDNNKMDLREIQINRANWMQLAEDRVKWWAFVSMVMSLNRNLK